MDKDAINFLSGGMTSERIEKDRSALLDAVRMIYEKGRGVASKLYNRTYFTIAQTPEFMKKYGLIGNYFTIGYGVISHHIGKDEAHKIPIDVWQRLPEALRTPFAITKYYKIEIDKNTGKKERGEFPDFVRFLRHQVAHIENQ